MTKEFIKKHLGFLIYDLGEKYFNCINNDFWDKHVNKGEPFTEDQIELFELFLKGLFQDLKEGSDKNIFHPEQWFNEKYPNDHYLYSDQKWRNEDSNDYLSPVWDN